MKVQLCIGNEKILSYESETIPQRNEFIAVGQDIYKSLAPPVHIVSVFGTLGVQTVVNITVRKLTSTEVYELFSPNKDSISIE